MGQRINDLEQHIDQLSQNIGLQDDHQINSINPTNSVDQSENH